MNTIWSTYLQSIASLYLTRSLRFNDCFKDLYIGTFGIDNRKSILEIGCGPGALTQALRRWYPQSELLGIDRDTDFIKFAATHAADVNFLEADVIDLPFCNNMFDVIISNTVQEHIKPQSFFSEQYRVLAPNGICLVLSSRRGISIPAECIALQTELEKEVYKKTIKRYADIEQKYSVGAYSLSESELPITMQTYGFRSISTKYLAINLTPDNSEYSPQMAHEMINANRQVELDSVDYLANIASDIVSPSELAELRRVKNEKYDMRISLYDAGKKQWDTNVCLTMVLRGIK